MSHELFNLKQSRTAWFDLALAEDRFETWYQPVVDIKADGISLIGHECLIRYTSVQANGRLHKAGEILEAARIRNDIRNFDAYARELAVRSSALERHITGVKTPYFVNFLPGSMPEPEAAMRPLVELIATAGMKPSDFVFEAVEADLVGDSARLRRIQDCLRHHGFGFALDNVGIGATPTHSVSDLRPDYVKIDKNVVHNIGQPIFATTVRKLAGVAKDVGAKIIATGVHRMHMMENLRLAGVDLMQGYLFGRALPNVVRTIDQGAVEAQMIESDLTELARAVGREQMPESLAEELQRELVPVRVKSRERM